MNEIIKIKNLYYSYNKKVDALSDINLTINKGEEVSIIGHNGSGKSTLGKIIVSLLKPTKGELIFEGTKINDKNDSIVRNKAGIVFQNPDNQFIGVTVKDDIAFGLENKRVKHELMDEIIFKYAQKVGVEHLLNKQPSDLSGGQKQRVAIAGILAMLPDLIVFDEALVMLDPKGKKGINTLIKQIKKENPALTIIRITHDLDETLESNRLIVLSKGKIIYNDEPFKVYKNMYELKKIGLKVPFIVEVNKTLKQEGLIKKEIFDLEKLADEICR